MGVGFVLRTWVGCESSAKVINQTSSSNSGCVGWYMGIYTETFYTYILHFFSSTSHINLPTPSQKIRTILYI